MLFKTNSFSKYFSKVMLTSALCAAPVFVHAAAFYIQEQSVSALGSASAGSAALAEDASTIFFNPAGMTELSGAQMMLGTHLLRPSASVTDTGSTVTNAFATVSTGSDDGGNPFDIAAIPNAYFAYPVNDNVWIGLGISAPFGLKNDYGRNWIGRYDSVKSALTTIDVAPSVAYKANNWLSIGGGLNLQYADAQLQSAIASPLTAGGPSAATDGLSDLSGDDTSIGFNVGALLKLSEGTKIGIHYRSGMEHELDGRLVITAPVDAGAGETIIPGNVGLDLPDVATVSFAQKLTDRLEILGSASWIGWSDFNSIPVELATGAVSVKTINYTNTNSYAIGARYEVNEDWTLRAGYQFDETPTNDQFRSTSIPDGDRNWFAAGVNYKVNDKWSLDVGAVYVDVSEESVNLNETFTGATATTNVLTEGDVGILSIAASYKF